MFLQVLINDKAKLILWLEPIRMQKHKLLEVYVVTCASSVSVMGQLSTQLSTSAEHHPLAPYLVLCICPVVDSIIDIIDIAR